MSVCCIILHYTLRKHLRCFADGGRRNCREVLKSLTLREWYESKLEYGYKFEYVTVSES